MSIENDSQAAWRCPITQEVMVDPVIAPDGNTYERVAIEAWLQRSQTSPITRQVMLTSDLIPNRALRDTIEAVLGVRDAPQNTAVIIPPIEGRNPCKFVCVIDVSGSMDSASDPLLREAGFSALDLVKHSMKTIIHMMTSQDKLAIVEFSDDATVLVPLSSMDADARKNALEKVDAMRTRGGTNIWEGLQKGLAESDGSDVHMLLLTDGESTSDPPRGLVYALNARLLSMGERAPTVTTFGFGYGINSKVLYDLAVEGKGMYSFIPDCTMVGTVFINYLAAILAGEETTLNASDEALHQDFIRWLTLDYAAALRAGGHLIATKVTEFAKKTSGSRVSTSPFIDALKSDVDSKDSNEGQIGKAFSKEEWWTRWGRHYIPSVIRAHQLKICNNFKDVSVQFFGKGERFIALQKEAENVFCGLPPPKPSHSYHSYYSGGGGPGGGGGGYSLAAATAAGACAGSSGRGSSSPAHSEVTSMSMFHNASGGCFHPSTLVSTPKGVVGISSLRKGDVVNTRHGGGSATIRHVVKTVTSTLPTSMFAMVNGVKLTPYHPIYEVSSKEWVFPGEHYPCISEHVDAVYNLVLDGGHIVRLVSSVSGDPTSVTSTSNNAFEVDVFACTLGHGFTGPVIGHSYFGTSRVIEDVSTLVEVDGQNVLNHLDVQRNRKTGLVCRFLSERAASISLDDRIAECSMLS